MSDKKEKADKYVKYLGRLLRRKGPENLQMSSDGWVKVDDILNLKQKENLSFNIIKEIVEKKNWHYKHFELKEEDGKFYVRATFGHNIKGLDYDNILKLITEPEKYPTVIHETSLREWEKIEKEGLIKPQKENLIYFVCKYPKKDFHSHEVYLEVDLMNAFKDGIKFYKGPNGFIASNESINRKYFKTVTKEVISSDKYPIVVHVTSYTKWDSIKIKGLTCGGRNGPRFLKFSIGHPKPSADEIHIEIDLKQALKDKMKFYTSTFHEGYILSPEDISPKYFINTKMTTERSDASNGAIKKIIPSTVRKIPPKRERHESKSSVETPPVEDFPAAIYGTSWRMWREIEKHGLTPEGNQTLIYFSTKYPKSAEQLKSNQIYIDVDVAKATRDGMIFNARTKNCIATTGLNGVIPPKYFKLVMKEINAPDNFPTVVFGTVARKLKSILRKGIKHEHNGWAYLRNGYPKKMNHHFYVEINLKKAIGVGMKFYSTSDGGIMSPEKINGVISPKFFKCVKNRKMQEIKRDQLDELDVWEIAEL